MLLIDKDIPHMPLSELENDSESILVKVFANFLLCGKMVSTICLVISSIRSGIKAINSL